MMDASGLRLVIIHEGGQGNVLSRVQNLCAAAASLEMPSLILDSQTCSYAGVLPLGKDDLLINAGRGSERLESLLISADAVTFYKVNPLFVSDRSDSTVFAVVHEKAGIPAPKTVHSSTCDRELLSAYVHYLGGFPIVVKQVGGTMGIGTIIVESMRSLKSTIDALSARSARFIMRQYIEPAEIARLTVLGGEVVASNRKFIPENEFRSSVTERSPEPKRYSSRIESLATKATQSLGLDFGGVDIVIDHDGRAYVLELNFPCDYLTSEIACRVPIGRLMVRFLVNKARS